MCINPIKQEIRKKFSRMRWMALMGYKSEELAKAMELLDKAEADELEDIELFGLEE